MNKFIFAFFILTISFSNTLVAQKNNKTTIKAYIDYKNFHSKEVGNYIEIYLQFAAHTFTYNENPEGKQASCTVSMQISKDDSTIISDNYLLKSPLFKEDFVEDFFDLKRFKLNPGNYILNLQLTDVNSSNQTKGRIAIQVNDLSKGNVISDIQPLEQVYKSTAEESQFFKNGYEILPRISNYYSNEYTKLPVYFEVYSNSSKEEIFGLKQTIRNLEKNEILEKFTRYSKIKVNSTTPIIRVIEIDSIYTGNHELKYELINSKNETISTSIFKFNRTNDIEETFVKTDNIVIDPSFQKSITEDSVQYYLASLIPISNPAEVKNIINILKSKDDEKSRKYIQSYWIYSTKNKNVTENWLKYKQQVIYVEEQFGTRIFRGFETDRGRVYLQYGMPNSTIVRESSPTEYPYEIWVYDKIKQYSNKRFIFYNPDLVVNNHVLLHSDMIGELSNYRWQQALSKRNSPNQNIDDPNDGNFQHYGGNSSILYQQK